MNHIIKIALRRINLKHLLIAIFILALILRFYSFKQSTYFGFDEARDAYISQSIYTNRDIKIVGPPASNQPGIFHGPLFWYLVGPLYLLGGGNPYIVSAVFRGINAFGVFFIYLIGRKLFNSTVGILSSFLYAISFEQTQYAMYVGNPSLAVLAWMGIILGAILFIKEKKEVGVQIMFACAALAMQFDFFLIYTFIIVLLYLFLGRRNLKKIRINIWLISAFSVNFILSSFIISEIKYNFQTSRGLMAMIFRGYDLIQPSETRLSVYVSKFLDLFHFNVLNIPNKWLILLVLGMIIALLKNWKKIEIKILLIWVFSSLLIVPFGMGEALYFNVGIGLGVIVAVAYLMLNLWGYNKHLTLLLMAVIVWSNLVLVRNNNLKGLLVGIKPQPHMQLTDEISLINKMYSQSEGKGFTIRVTGIPYGIQTVWAYLFDQYGLKKYGYLPYFETGNIEGFPGKLPEPVRGTTCQRYLITEPTRGIPINLIKKNIEEENNFSKTISEYKYGEFVLQSRIALDKNCHNEKPAN